jgi:hypothetical protein
MKSRDFVSAVLNEEICKSQPLGFIKAEYPKREYSIIFSAGVFDNVKIYPKDLKTKHSPWVEVKFSDEMHYNPTHDKDYLKYRNVQKEIRGVGGLLPNSVPIVDEIHTVYTAKEDFMTEMNRLMKEFEENKNKNFPLFVRDLSKLDGWK